MRPDQTTDATLIREREVAAALASIAKPDVFPLLRVLLGQPRDTWTVCDLLDMNPDDVWDLAVPLCASGVLVMWDGSGMQLTRLGDELWSAIRPIVDPE